jgi:hypothetical protein
MGVDLLATKPAIPEAAKLVPHSYDVSIHRVDRADDRLQHMTSVVMAIAAGIPVFVGAGTAAVPFGDWRFLVGMLLMGAAIALGITGRAVGKIRVLDLEVLHDHYLDQSPAEFQRTVTETAGGDTKHNRDIVRTKTRYLHLMTVSAAAAVVAFVMWIAALS